MDGSSRPDNQCIQMHAIQMNIWIFGRSWSQKEIWTKNSHVRHGDFFPNYFCVWTKKSHISTFERDLAVIWKNQIFGYMNFLTDRQIMADSHLLKKY